MARCYAPPVLEPPALVLQFPASVAENHMTFSAKKCVDAKTISTGSGRCVWRVDTTNTAE